MAYKQQAPAQAPSAIPASVLLCGDEVKAVCMDIGSATCR